MRGELGAVRNPVAIGGRVEEHLYRTVLGMYYIVVSPNGKD